MLEFCLFSTSEGFLQIFNLCEFMCVSALWCLFSSIHLPSFAFTIISPLLPHRSLRVDGKDLIFKKISFHTEFSKVSHSLHCPIMGLCVDYTTLQEEASLMSAELSTHLRSLRVTLLLNSNDSLRKHAIFVFYLLFGSGYLTQHYYF